MSERTNKRKGTLGWHHRSNQPAKYGPFSSYIASVFLCANYIMSWTITGLLKNRQQISAAKTLIQFAKRTSWTKTSWAARYQDSIVCFFDSLVLLYSIHLCICPQSHLFLFTLTSLSGNHVLAKQWWGGSRRVVRIQQRVLMKACLLEGPTAREMVGKWC